MADQVAIDPNTGERIGVVTIDPATGERVAAKDGLIDRLQRSFDTNTKYDKNENPVRNLIAGTVNAAGSPFVHPIDTALGIAKSFTDLSNGFINPQAKQSWEDAAKEAPYVAGQAIGGTALGEITKGTPVSSPVKVAQKAATSTAETMHKVGESAQAVGNKVINETVGSYKSDFKRGANPGRGYNSTGQGISFTMRGLAEKAETAKQSIGSNIQKVITAANVKGLIPFSDVADAVGKPLREAYDAETSPGGLGNTDVYEKYSSQFKKTLSEGFKKGGFTPQEVFDLKKQIAAKAKFSNTTPEGILDVRQSQVGALGGLLKDVIPELAPLNQAYQDLVRLGDRAAWRAESGSMSLGRMVGHGSKVAAAGAGALVGGPEAGLGAGAALAVLDSTAGRTALASGLYGAGKTLANAGTRLEDWLRNRP